MSSGTDAVAGCDGVANSGLVDDQCGVCDGDNSSCADCAGVPNGTAWSSDCGCVATENDGNDCDDCAGVPNGNGYIDECGVCNGDGTSCHIYVDLSLGDGADGSLDVFMSNSHPVSAFQFDIDGMDISDASGGSADAAGFDVATGPNGVLGISFTGADIPAGDGLLTNLSGSFTDFNVSITDLIVTTNAEGFLHLSGNGFSAGTDAVAGCDGVANSGLVDDQCGVCLLYTSPSPRDATLSRMPSSA